MRLVLLDDGGQTQHLRQFLKSELFNEIADLRIIDLEEIKRAWPFQGRIRYRVGKRRKTDIRSLEREISAMTLRKHLRSGDIVLATDRNFLLLDSLVTQMPAVKAFAIQRCPRLQTDNSVDSHFNVRESQVGFLSWSPQISRYPFGNVVPKDVIPVGSLEYFSYIESRKALSESMSQVWDVCLVSTFQMPAWNLSRRYDNSYYSAIEDNKCFCEKLSTALIGTGWNLVIALRWGRDTTAPKYARSTEENYFKEFFGDSISFSDPEDPYSTFACGVRSRVVVGLGSCAQMQLFAHGNRSLFDLSWLDERAAQHWNLNRFSVRNVDSRRMRTRIERIMELPDSSYDAEAAEISKRFCINSQDFAKRFLVALGCPSN